MLTYRKNPSRKRGRRTGNRLRVETILSLRMGLRTSDMDQCTKSTVLILGITVVTYTIVGALLGFAVTYFFTGGSGWKYGMALFLMIAIACSVYAVVQSGKPLVEKLRGKGVTADTEPRLYSIVQRLAEKERVPMPEVFVLDVDYPNAFALGRGPDDAMVAATAPLMRLLSDEELEGVMAHEISHIVNRDTAVNGTARISAKLLTVSAIAMGGVGVMLLASLGMGSNTRSGGNGILFLIVLAIAIPVMLVCLVMAVALPFAAALMRFGVSRNREYGADESAAYMTGKPMALARALVKLDEWCGREANDYGDASAANLWIVNPFGRRRRRLLCSLLDTHPSVEDRVERLAEIEKTLGAEKYRR